MTVSRVVSFRIKDGVSRGQVLEFMIRMYNQKEECRHPQTGKPYIRSCTERNDGGTTSAAMGPANPPGRGIEVRDGTILVFVLEFDSDEDRVYYVSQDPVHAEFREWSDSMVAEAHSADFSSGAT